MENATRVDDALTVARFEPQADDFARFAEHGFRAVVSLQTHEEEQKLQPHEERRQAEAAGLAFLHQPVKGDALTPDSVDRFREALRALPKPALLHCASGKRAGAMALMHVAAERGMTGDAALEMARRLGIELGDGPLERLVRDYAERNARS